MKSAYELAMERLGGSKAGPRLTADQKARLAELDSVYKAKLAQEDLACRDEVARLLAGGDAEAAAERQSIYREQKRRLETELEEKKDRVRAE